MCKVIWIFNKRFLVINITHRWGKNVPFWTQYTSELTNPNLCFYLNNPWEKTMKSIFKWLNHPFGFSIYSFVLLISKFYAWTCCSCGSIFLYFFLCLFFFLQVQITIAIDIYCKQVSCIIYYWPVPKSAFKITVT